MLRAGLVAVIMLVSWWPLSSAGENEGPQRFNGFAKAPPFEVVPQEDRGRFYPCMRCHRVIQPNPNPRPLHAPHRKEQNHGDGRMWCTTCHHLENRDKLTGLLDDEVDYDRAYIVCGSCHAVEQRDWFFGGHGKRASGWDEQRRLYNCTHCHDPHDPPIKEREPGPPPTARGGLQRHPPSHSEHLPVWRRMSHAEEGSRP